MVTGTKRENLAAWTERLRAAGLCVRCGKRPPQAGHVVCGICMRKTRLRRKRLWAERREAGLCPSCGGERSEDRFIICRDCRARQIESKQKMLTRELVKRYNMKWKNNLRRNGLCSKCGGPKDTELRWCSKCQAKARSHYWDHREKIIAYNLRRYRLNYRPKDLCPICESHRRKCPICCKYMKTEHQNGQGSCLFSCTCGITIRVFR